MNRRTIAVGLVAVFAATTVGAVVLAVTGGGGSDEGSGPKATTTATAALNASAQELVDRLAAARKRPLHLVYAGDLVAARPEAGKLAIEIWWKGDLARQDIRADAPQLTQEQSAFVLPTGNVTCLKDDKGAWSCQRSVSVATAAGKPAGIIESLVAQLNGKQVTSAKAKVGDTDADCYTLDEASQDVVCLRSDGVPVKFTLSGSQLVATSVATDVKDDDFKPPAEPTELPATPATPTTGG